MDKLLQAMRKKEQSRKRKATKDFLAKMDKLEAETLTEIETAVGLAKHKARGIAEKLYGPDNDRIKKLFETKSQ